MAIAFGDCITVQLIAMHRPLKSKNEANAFNIGEILDNPSVFGKQALSRQPDKPPSRPVNSRPTGKPAVSSTNGPQRLRKRSNDEDRPAKRIAPVSRLKDAEQIAEEIKQRKHEVAKKVNLEDYAQKSNIVRFNQSSYDVMHYIQRKRELHSSLPVTGLPANRSAAGPSQTNNYSFR